MAYENILFHKTNMATLGGYFYSIDYPQGALFQKNSDGSMAFEFPLDIPDSFVHYAVEEVTNLQFDGYSLWSIQKLSAGNGSVIRKWVIDNYICVLSKQFPKIDQDSVVNYHIDTFAVESYTTKLTEDIYDGELTIKLEDYTDFAVFPGTVIGLGYNKYGEREQVTVSGVNGQTIYLKDPLTRNYFAEDQAVITSSLMLFNNYFFTDDTLGSLIILDPNSGFDISVTGDVEYQGIRASKFARLFNIIQGHPDIYTLTYVKGTNLKLKDISDMYRYSADIKASDHFDGPDYSLPDTTNWDISAGNPEIQNNQLYCSTAGNGHDKLNSSYNLVGDFDVQVSGVVTDRVSFGYGSYLNHYIGLEFSNPTSAYYLSRSITGLSIQPYTHYDMSTLTSSGILADLSTNNISGYLTDTVSVSGISGNALSFNGISSSVDINDYSLDGQFKTVFFHEDFEVASDNWRFSNASRSSIEGHQNSGEWSIPLRGGATMTSRTISTIPPTTSGIRLLFWAKIADNDILPGPEGDTDTLHVEYYSSGGSWREAYYLSATAPYGTEYMEDLVLPEDANHKNLRLRFSNSSNHSTGDYWCVDDIMVVSSDFIDEPTEFFMSFYIKPSILNEAVNYVGLSNTFFSQNSDDANIIFMDNFSSTVNWDLSGANFDSYTSKYGVTSISVNGNYDKLTLKNPLDLSSYTSNIKLYIWLQLGSNEWCSYCSPEANDYVRIEYYNSSGSWVNIGNITGGNPMGIEELNYTLPADALHSEFFVRFWETTNSTGNADFFSFSDIIIYDASDGDITIQPRPSVALGISPSGDLQIALTTSSTQALPTVLTLGTGDIVIDEWTFVGLTFADGTVTANINDSVYTQYVGQKYLFKTPQSSTNIGRGYVGIVDDCYLVASKIKARDLRLLRLNEAEESSIQCGSTLSNTDPEAYTLVTGTNQKYNFRLTRQNTNLNVYYRLDDTSSWVSLHSVIVPAAECSLVLGLVSKLYTVYTTYFDNLLYTEGTLRYPTSELPYYGIMGMDNVQTNQSTVHTIYDIDIEGDNLYRLQKTATYYGEDYSWSTYNFQISPIRSFIDFITIDADSHILPATGRNTTPVRSVTLDQYGQGVVNRPVTFIDDDDVGFITSEIVYTDIFYGTGKANTAYTSGTSLRVVDINAKVTQLD